MIPSEGLSQPVRRLLSEWLSRFMERLVQFQYQLRYGLIRIISSSVAETIENRLHGSSNPRLSYEADDDDYEEYEPYQAPRSNLLTRTVQWIAEWLQKPWVEPVMAGCVTFVSLFLLTL